MTDYEKQAAAAALEYEKKRKQTATEAADSVIAAAEAEKQAELDKTADKIATERAEALRAVDTAAVEREITRRQVGETLSRLGLTASGQEAAQLTAADTAARWASEGARRTRDKAVAALTEALERREQEIDRKRDAETSQIYTDAEEDIATESSRLYEAAITAAGKAEAERLRIQESQRKEAEAERRREETRERNAATAAAKEAESQRRAALKALFQKQGISADVYAEALVEGWSVDEARSQQAAWKVWRTFSGKLVQEYARGNKDSVIKQLAAYDPTERELTDLSIELGLDIDALRNSIAAAKKGG